MGAPSLARIAVNGRFAAHPVTGVQRYARELTARFGDHVEVLSPNRPLVGASGHLWEQLVLPLQLHRRLLWSPNNTGPVNVRHQVCTFHDVMALEHPEWFNRRFAAWHGWLLPRLAKSVRHIITVSEFSKSRILDRTHIGPAKVTVIPNGVDARFTPRPPQEIAAVRRALAIPGYSYLLTVGSLAPNKNLPRLLDAWRQASYRVSDDLWLVVAGAKGRSLVFADVCLEWLPPRVHLTGYVEESCLPALYSGALALVLPSLYEGFGLPALEAMSCGVPVVVSQTAALPEVVGDCAMFVDAYEVESIAEALVQIAQNDDLRQRLRLAGLARSAQFSWEKAARQTWGVLTKAEAEE